MTEECSAGEVATKVWEKIDLSMGLTYGRWSNVFDNFTVLSTGLSWKQKYENKKKRKTEGKQR